MSQVSVPFVSIMISMLGVLQKCFYLNRIFVLESQDVFLIDAKEKNWKEFFQCETIEFVYKRTLQRVRFAFEHVIATLTRQRIFSGEFPLPTSHLS